MAIGEAVDFEMFRPLLDRLLGVRAAGPGRPPWDRVLMSRIHEQRLAGKELSESQKQSNRIKSKVRARIEHRFGRMRTTLKGLVRSIGLVRCRASVGLLNLLYNLTEYARLCQRAVIVA